jgi:hypothetical protein
VKSFLRLLCILATLCETSNAATIQAVGLPVASAAPALAIVNTLDYPADWHIYIAGEKQWADLMTKVDHTSQLAVTDRKQRITVIRALALADPNVTGKYVTAHHVLAHELGHIVCNCNDEWKAENYANAHDHYLIMRAGTVGSRRR